MIEWLKKVFDMIIAWLAKQGPEVKLPPLPDMKPTPVPEPSKWPKFSFPVGPNSPAIEQIKLIQIRLNALGWKIDIDGFYEDETTSAVKEFQHANSLGETGVVGEQTWPVMFSDDAKPKPAHGGSGHASRPAVDDDYTSECPNCASRNGIDIDTVILHNTEGSLDSAVSRFLDAGEQVSAHFIVGRDARLVQMVSESMTAWHSGARNTNQRSIGIEIVAGGGQGVGMTPEQEKTVVALCKYLMEAYDISLSRVLPHRQIVSTSCPGSIWKSDIELEYWKRQKLS